MPGLKKVDRRQSLTHQAILEYSHSNSFRAGKGSLAPGTVDKILRYGAPVGSRIEQYESIPRCMVRIQELIVEAEMKGKSLANGTVVFADHLFSSSGRFDRQWHAPSGGVWCALAWADTLLPEYARLLPLAAGTACCQTIRSFGIDARVKWVNDIHAARRKIAGILCETFSSTVSGERYHLIGLGINCNNSVFPDELHQTAVSMQEMLNEPVDLQKVKLELMAGLAWNIGLIHCQEEMELAEMNDSDVGREKGMVVDAWLNVSDSVGHKVVYGYDVVRQPLYHATVLDVEHSGALVLELPDGEVVTEHSGEIIYLD